MAGKIHGLISREQAWQMWAPYGERVMGDLDGSFDKQSITPYDAAQVAWGSNMDEQTKIWSCYYDYENGDTRGFIEGIRDTFEQGVQTPELVDNLTASQSKQQANAERLRMKAIEDGPKRAKLLYGAVFQLAYQGILTTEQAATMQSWIYDADGLPAMQYTPMSQLEYGRLSLKYDGDEADLNGTDCTDFSFGIFRNVVGSSMDSKIARSHNRVHESVHGNLSGVEIWDITGDDEIRIPVAAVVGHFAFPPSTKVQAGDDFNHVENCEINEGWTEFISRELMRVQPKLGRPLSIEGGYGAWSEVVGTIYQNDPQLFNVITDAALVEATPSEPTIKREALEEMKRIVTQKLGVVTVDSVFIDAGGALTDIYTKGKSKD